MFRMRRYRVFLVFAVITVFVIYKFGSSGATWQQVASSAAERWEDVAEDAAQYIHKPNVVAQETRKFTVDVPAATRKTSLQTPPAPAAPINPPAGRKSSASASSTAVTPKLPQQHIPTIPTPAPNPKLVQPGGRPADAALAFTSSVEQVHWSKLPENFPVPSQSMIKLPDGKSKSIKKIQFDFKPETLETRAERTAKLDTIRDVFKKSWKGYKELAWEHDELMPVSGKFKDPFAGWRATLVDALDTLWIMGLKEEFADAVKAVSTIDFTTTSRADIPLFETTIRYLGGLLAAYDVSEKQYRVLLDKAVELAEVLYSAFDTPNRMPETYYYWRSEFASNAHRASSRVVLAEIGSLSMEFTRLAQLTGDHKYYDAIARITDNLEEFQNNTRLPGMWPTYLDASGCKMVAIDVPAQAPLVPMDDVPTAGVSTPSPTPTETEQLSPDGKKMIPLDLPDPIVLTPNGVNPTWVPPQEGLADPMLAALGNGAKMSALPLPALKRRHLDVDRRTPPKKATDLETDLLALQKGNMDKIKFDAASPTEPAMPAGPTCSPQGFASTSDYGREEYTLGGMSDSTYEYLPKQWLLLGAQVEKYRTMYEWSMDVVKEHLIFRPMLPGENDVLHSGKFNVQSLKDEPLVGDLEPENAHLTCFAGGMFGMGAKLFDRPEDLEIAKKLTEGCIYAYDMTATGIMPETYDAVPCESRTECPWNETMYHEILDPRSDWRFENYQEQLQRYQVQLVSASSWYEEQMASYTAAPTPVINPNVAAQATPTPSYIYADTLDKRQLIDLLDDATHVNMEDTPGVPAKPVNPSPPAAVRSPALPISQTPESVIGGESEEGEGPPTRVQPSAVIPELAEPSRTMPSFPYLYSPVLPLTHKEYVKNRIEEERLPEGVARIGSRNYILRPEAIESVWYMYRITGDSHWREAGWRMFEAVVKATTTEFGNSAIDDVTKTAPELNDSMESFWLAETLKYFYLLFADEELISLDEWVLNTEAHPFRRPA